MKTYKQQIIIGAVLFILVFLIMKVSQAQCNYSVNETDEFTGAKNISTKIESVAKKYMFNASFNSVDSLTFLVINPIYGNFGCVTKDSKIMVKFEDDTIIEIPHFGNINCQYGIITAILNPFFDELTTKRVSKIRYTADKGSADFELKDAELFIKRIPCVTSVGN